MSTIIRHTTALLCAILLLVAFAALVSIYPLIGVMVSVIGICAAMRSEGRL